MVYVKCEMQIFLVKIDSRLHVLICELGKIVFVDTGDYSRNDLELIIQMLVVLMFKYFVNYFMFC